MAWGDNRYGQLGDDSGHDQEVPVRVRGLDGVVAVAAGDGHSIALRHDGTIFGWGGNYHGQLGIGSYDNAPLPVKIPPSSFDNRIDSIAAGDNVTLAIERSSGQLWLWGWNIQGALGTGTLSLMDSNVPLKPGAIGQFTGLDIVAASGGFANCYAVDKAGRVWAWGDNVFDQLGPGHSHLQQDPSAYQIPRLTNVVEISAGSFHCLVRRRDGTLWGWGSNSVGQLGQALPIGPSRPPGQVVNLDHVAAFSGGHVHSLAIAKGTSE